MVSLVVSFPIINPLVNNESTVVIINPMVMDSTSDSTRFHIKTYENLAGKHAHPAHVIESSATPPAKGGSSTHTSSGGGGSADGSGGGSTHTSGGSGGGGGSSSTKTGVDIDINSEKSTDKFDYKKVGNYVTYTAKGDNAFKLVMDGEIEVWKASGNNYSSKIEVDLMSDGSKAVTVFPLDETKVFLKGSNDTSFTEIDVSKINAKTVNIGFEHESYFYKNELKDKIRTFTAKKGFAFNGANAYVDGDKFELWKTGSEKEFANKIVMDGKKVTIYLKDGTTKDVAKGSDGKWPQQCLGPKTGIYLNLKATAGTQQFNYNKDGKVVTFTARGNKGFKSVESKGTVVWSTDNVSEYASKVVLDGKGKKEKKLTLYLPNNTTKVFKRDGKGKPWTGVSQQNNQDNGQPCGSTPASGSNGTTGGRRMSSDPDGTPLASSGGDGTSSGSGTGQSTDGSGANHTSSGESTESGDCREDAKSGGWTSGSVQDGSASLPTTDGDSGTLTGVEESTDKGEGEDGSTQSSSGAPTSGGTGLTSAPDGSASKSPEDGGSSATPPASSGGEGTSATPGQGATATTQAENVKKTPVKLDIKQSSGTNEFDYKKENNIATFTAKDKHGFNVVRCKNMDYDRWVDIWKATNEREYSKKVVIEGDNKLTIHIGDSDSASTKVFTKVGYCKWKEDTQDSTQKSTTDGSGVTDQSSGGGTTGTDGSGGRGTQQSTPATQ